MALQGWSQRIDQIPEAWAEVVAAILVPAAADPIKASTLRV